VWGGGYQPRAHVVPYLPQGRYGGGGGFGGDAPGGYHQQ
jgi:hypothetical protein